MGWWEKTVWYCQGMSKYNRRGFDSAYRSFDVKALDMNLSGASSGIGKTVSKELGARGAVVHMLCRNQTKGDAAAAEIATATGKPASTNFIVHVVDLSSPKQVKQFAKDFIARNSRLDCLINNAGCQQTQRFLTPDGLECGFACNLLGTYVLTECLIPVLSKTSGARVVTVTSALMLTERLDACDPQSANGSFKGERAFARQKRGLVEITHHWATTYPSILFYSVHPGWVNTPGLQNSQPSLFSKNANKLRTPEQGADSILWCTVTPAAAQLPNGVFVEDRHKASEHVQWAGTSTAPGDLERLINYMNDVSSRFPVDGVSEPKPVTEKTVQPAPPATQPVQQPAVAKPAQGQN